MVRSYQLVNRAPEGCGSRYFPACILYTTGRDSRAESGRRVVLH